VQLIAAVGLVLSLAIAATAVSIGIAREHPPVTVFWRSAGVLNG
jgi:hypothetical protein